MSVEVTQFSVNQLAERERFEAWRASIACIFDVWPHGRDSDHPFVGSIRTARFGELMLSRTETRRQVWRRSPLVIARDGMDHYMVQLYTAGTQLVDWSDGTVQMPRNGLLVYDLARPMQARATDLSNLTLFVPRPVLEPLLAAPDSHHIRALDEGAPYVRLLREHMLSLHAGLDAQALADPSNLSSAVVHLFAACLNAADDGRPEPGRSYEPSLLRRARQEIERRLHGDDLTPESLCRTLGLSRTRLYEVFAPFGGVASYIRNRRLSAALQLVTARTGTPEPIGQIAARFQFTASELSRAFRTRYGVSPRQARRHGQTFRNLGESDGVDRRYERWMHDLSL